MWPLCRRKRDEKATKSSKITKIRDAHLVISEARFDLRPAKRAARMGASLAKIKL
jgi:hypothetical protein